MILIKIFISVSKGEFSFSSTIVCDDRPEVAKRMRERRTDDEFRLLDNREDEQNHLKLLDRMMNLNRTRIEKRADALKLA